MHYCHLIISLVFVIVAFAADQNLFEVWEDNSNAFSPVTGDGILSDELTSTDIPTQHALQWDTPTSSELDELDFGLLEDLGTDLELIANAPDECSTPSRKSRLRRNGIMCTADDADIFEKFTDYLEVQAKLTDFDRLSCPPPIFKSTPWFICSSENPDDTEYWISLSGWVLFRSTRRTNSLFRTFSNHAQLMGFS